MGVSNFHAWTTSLSSLGEGIVSPCQKTFDWFWAMFHRVNTIFTGTIVHMVQKIDRTKSCIWLHIWPSRMHP
jgi:hypothetical protein